MAYGLSPNAQRYAQTFSQQTGIPLRVVAAWMMAENPLNSDGSSFHYNWLNVSNLSGQGGRFAAFQSPEQAATEAARWVNTMPNYTGIKTAAQTAHGNDTGFTDLEIIQAIIKSPWEETHYKNGSLLMAAWNKISGEPIDPNVTPPVDTTGGNYGPGIGGDQSGLGTLQDGLNASVKALLGRSPGEAVIRVLETMFGALLFGAGILVILDVMSNGTVVSTGVKAGRVAGKLGGLAAMA